MLKEVLHDVLHKSLQEVLVGNDIFGEAWTPLKLSPSLWLDAKDKNTIFDGSNNNANSVSFDGNVKIWQDKSGNDDYVTQSVPADRFTYDSASNEMTLGATSFMSLPAGVVPSNNEDSDVFIVARSGDVNGGFISNGRFGSANESYSLRTFNSYSQMNFYFWGNDVQSSGFSALSNTSILNAKIDTSNNTRHVFQNSIEILSGVGNGLGDAKTTNGLIGKTYSNEYLQGGINEIIICKTNLSQSNKEKIEGYLAHKWGLTASLPSNHPYKTTPA